MADHSGRKTVQTALTTPKATEKKQVESLTGMARDNAIACAAWLKSHPGARLLAATDGG